MKKMIFTLMLSLCSILSLSAMSYAEAREQARFLTDKMAYELNLNDAQYNDCYEINLDYLLSVETADDIYGDYLLYRNADLRHILYDWQYTIFAAAEYFFRPLSWLHNRWYFPIYRHYRVGYYYYGYPTVYHSYRGGHGRFYHHGGFYASRRPNWNGGFRGMDRGHITHHGDGGRGYHFGDGGRGNRYDNHSRGGNPGYHIGDGRGNSHTGGRGYSLEGGRGNSHDNGRIDNGRGDNNGRGSYSHDNGRGSYSHDNSRGSYSHDNSRGSSYDGGRGTVTRSYDHPSSTRTTVNATSRGSSYSSMGSRGMSSSSMSGRSSASMGTRSMGSSSHGGFSGASHSGGSRGGSGGFGGSSRGGSSRGGGRGR